MNRATTVTSSTGRSVPAIAISALLVLAACSGTVAGPSAAPSHAVASLAPSVAPTAVPSEPLTEEFPYGSFANPATITNAYLPLKPGSYWKWDGVTVEDGEEISHQIVTMITDLTKVIDGVQTVVGYDEDWSDGELVEVEIFFAAQADDGTVWRLGEYPEVFEGGVLVEHPGWLAGYEDALAGIYMPAQPKVGERSYAQGWGPAVEWGAPGRVIEDALSDCVAVGCYDNVIIVEEWDIAEPLARQLKFHAPEIGVVRVDWAGSAEQSQENLELVEFRQLSAAEMSDLRDKALALEANAIRNLPDTYARTDAMERRG
jgi:hypothetical protein